MRGPEGGVWPHACRAGKRVTKTAQEFWSRQCSCREGSHKPPCAPDLFSTHPLRFCLSAIPTCRYLPLLDIAFHALHNARYQILRGLP